MRALLLTALLGLTALAGCLDADEPTAPADALPDTAPLFDYLNATLPSGQAARDLIESYIMTHPYRVEGPATQSFMDTARDGLEAELLSYGQHVVRQPYDGGVNILAFQNGTTNPDQWVVLSAHYDTIGAGVGTTVYGAWDDGAGVALLMEMARTLADWEFPFTVVYAFFDGEEKGLVGSREFMKVYDPSEQDEVDLLANLNTDPPGLNWPCGQQPLGDFPVKIIHEMDKVDGGSPRYALLHQAVEHGLAQAEVPDAVRDYTPGIPIATVAGEGLRGGSDHLSFGARGVANVFLGGTPTTFVNGSPGDSDGGAAALTYPLHTPLDTLEAMEARCVTGSLAGGLQTIVTTMTHALVYLAQSEIPEAGLVE